MIDPLFVLSEAMNTDLFRMRSISQNLANVNTPGYKRGIARISSFESLVDKPAEVALGNSGPGAVSRQMVTDFGVGVLKPTGNANDVAIGSDAFFVVKGAAGESYTRKGKFMVDRNGMLALQSGEQVMGEQGSIRLSTDPFVIHDDGRIEQEGIIVDRLNLVRFINTDNVNYMGRGLFLAQAAAVEAWGDGSPDIAQGYVEASNVDTTDEMVKMMETVRHFEGSATILKGYDQMLDASINILADLNQ